MGEVELEVFDWEVQKKELNIFDKNPFYIGEWNSIPPDPVTGRTWKYQKKPLWMIRKELERATNESEAHKSYHMEELER